MAEGSVIANISHLTVKMALTKGLLTGLEKAGEGQK